MFQTIQAVLSGKENHEYTRAENYINYAINEK